MTSRSHSQRQVDQRHHRAASALDELRLVAGDPEVGDHSQPLLDRDLHLAPGEVLAEAAVRTAGEAHVVVALAVGDELVRVLVGARVAVRRRTRGRRPCRRA